MINKILFWLVAIPIMLAAGYLDFLLKFSIYAPVATTLCGTGLVYIYTFIE